MLLTAGKMIGGIVGVALGDALGVPVEFQSRQKRIADPVIGFRSFGTHNQPEGTWSDDTSLTLCTLESLIQGVNFEDIMRLFAKWYDGAHWTATGKVFDVGITTSHALQAFKQGNEAIFCGPMDEMSNGNGALMRILPVALASLDADEDDRRTRVFKAVGLTHGHARSKIACWLYSEIVFNIFQNKPKTDSVDDAFDRVRTWCLSDGHALEWEYFARCSSDIAGLSKAEIRSSGYVVHALEASLYCFLLSVSPVESCLMAVNLGEDTDTTAAITGGLAGVFYGLNAIPENWLSKIKRIEEIVALSKSFAEVYAR